MESSAASAPGYEFTPAENETLGKAAKWIGFWSWVSIVSGIIWGLGSVFTVEVGGVVMGAAYVVVGFYFRSAARSMRSVVETEGNDISHLMTAVEKLSAAFKVMGVIFIIAVILSILVGVMVGAAGG